MNIPQITIPRVVIIGGGFAGIQLAKKLAKQEVQVVMLDKHNYHTFQPLLYQVSTGGLEPDSIAYPIRKILSRFPNFYFRLANVTRIDPEAKKLETNIGPLKYDYLVLATGSKTNFFGNKEIELNSMIMKTVPEALNLRSLILQNFEKALLTDSLDEQDALMNFVIVGGGPTGVELAGALAEIKKGILPKDYPDLDTRRAQINIVQSSDRVLDGMSEVASRKAEEFLEKMGVNIWKDTLVTGYDGDIVSTNSELTFRTATMIWAAGVEGALIDGLKTSECLLPGNRLKVNEFLQVSHYKNIFAIGDIACMTSEDYPRGHPMVAQVAMQQGRNLGDNLLKILENKTDLKPFVYKDKGTMATIGRNKAVVDLPSWKFQGFFAWFVWMFVHLLSLIGFRNRAIVFVNWVYNYIRFDRAARLIIRPYKKETRSKDVKVVAK
ncbi:NADH dehydrogenase (ubiquinone) [Galbibacter marinus]|uniref:NADH:ubiquinone reductase (non-electrogenic) n=1 Tax=Galbibacter marinus TaxID=555500 RepID=K2P578_9FLAO|nr:NAD(P)/FAD-dependent oxidoreductase [Galbibacter marinus]EKF56163.1 NADH dehydrogenase (ubiquinone) [Galbibacter marinus]